MHPNRTITNKISMIIFNLKIIHVNRLVKFFNPMFLNKQIFAIYADKFITNEQTSCIDKTPALYIKRVIISCYNFFTINCEVNKLFYLTDIRFKNRFRCGFKRIRICIQLLYYTLI